MTPQPVAATSSGPSGITDLVRLLAELEPQLEPGFYCFTSIPQGQPSPAHALMTFQETEGTTLILQLEQATAEHIETGFICRKITLLVPSSLEAVGMMAAIAQTLKEAAIPCNVVAGYHHDHLFVAPDHAEAALEALRALQRQAKSQAAT